MGQHAYPDPLRFIGAFNAPAPNNTALNDLVVKGGIQKLGDIAAGQRNLATITGEGERLQTQIDADIASKELEDIALRRRQGTEFAQGIAKDKRKQRFDLERLGITEGGLDTRAAAGLISAEEIAAGDVVGRQNVVDAESLGAIMNTLAEEGLTTPDVRSSLFAPEGLDRFASSSLAARHSTVLKNLADSGVGALSPELAGSLGELTTDRSYYPPNPELFKGVSQENAAKSALEAQRTIVKKYSKYIFEGNVIDVPSKVDFTETTRMTAGLKEAQGLIALLHWPLADLRSIGFERGIDKRTGNTFVGRRDAGGKITVLIEGVPE